MATRTLFNVPDGYVLIKPIEKKGEVRMMKAVRADVLEVMLARSLNMTLSKSKKGYVTVKEAENRLHLDRIVDPSGHVSFSVSKIVEQHPLEFALNGKHIVRAVPIVR
jgi:hypothetical protein